MAKHASKLAVTIKMNGVFANTAVYGLVSCIMYFHNCWRHPQAKVSLAIPCNGDTYMHLDCTACCVALRRNIDVCTTRASEHYYNKRK